MKSFQLRHLKYLFAIFVFLLNFNNIDKASAMTCEYASTTPYTIGANVTFNNSSSTAPKSEVVACLSISANSLNDYDNILSFKLNDQYALLNQDACPTLKYKVLQPMGLNNKIKDYSFKSENDIYFNPGFTLYLKSAEDFSSNTRDQNFNTRCYYAYSYNTYLTGNDAIYISFDTSNWNVFAKSNNYTNKLITSPFQAGYYGEVLYEQSNETYNLPIIEKGAAENNFLTKYMKSEDLNFNKAKPSPNPVSDIMFFPGVLGSNLYKTQFYHSPTGIGNRLWPSNFTSDQLKMKIDNPSNMFKYGYQYDTNSDGVATESDLHSKYYAGVTRTVDVIDIYDSFLTELDKLKANNEMTDYSAIPYDFRLATDNIYCDASLYYDKIYYNTNKLANADYYRPWTCKQSFIYQDLLEHIHKSKTGKVTLIAHSYGGLVVKEMLKQLEDSNDPLINKIDKVILVAVPQAGAPESVISLLHGKQIGHLGLPIDTKTDRELADTFPSIYQLLPNDSLIKSINTDPNTPLISFTSRSNRVATNSPSDYSKQINKYGNTIDNFAELSDYLLNKENSIRATTTNDLHRAASLYSNLLNHATTEKNKLDNYVPTSTIEVHQIAGWGLPTDIGYKYDYIDNACVKYNNGGVSNSTAQSVLSCAEFGSIPLLNVTLSKNGDDTVPVPSALWMDPSSHSNVHNWWVDLAGYNSFKFVTRSHKDILTSTPALNKVFNLIRNKDQNIQYISNTSPLYTKNNYITYSAHSPVNMTITDSNGNISGYDKKTNTIVNNINDVYYEQIGDTKVMIVTENINHTLNLSGYDNGVYTLNVNNYTSEGVTLASTTYYAIPTAPDSQSYIKHDTLATTTDSLLLDYNNNGLVDAILNTSKTDNKVSYTASTTIKETIKISDYLTFATTTSTSTDDGPILKVTPMPTVIDDIIKKPILIQDIDIKLIKRKK